MSVASPLLRIAAPAIGLDVAIDLLADHAPRHAALLGRIAKTGTSFTARHARHTGPEISCPIEAATLPFAVDTAEFEPENATRHPLVGDVVLVVAQLEQWGSFPPYPLVDIGLFYGADGTLQFPFGWVDGSVCAQVRPADHGGLRRAGERLRMIDSCVLTIGPAV